MSMETWEALVMDSFVFMCVCVYVVCWYVVVTAGLSVCGCVASHKNQAAKWRSLGTWEALVTHSLVSQVCMGVCMWFVGVWVCSKSQEPGGRNEEYGDVGSFSDG